MIMNFIILLSFVAMALWEFWQFSIALKTRRARRITFRTRYVIADEDNLDFWAATAFHGLAAVFLTWMSITWANGIGVGV
jgi:hypothetical protein